MSFWDWIGTSGTNTGQLDEDRRRALEDQSRILNEQHGARVTYQDMNPAFVAGVNPVTAPRIDDGQAQEIRAREMAALSPLERRASGAGPSVGGLLVRQQAGDIAAQQMGAAGQARGAAAVAARRNALRNIARARVQSALGGAAVDLQDQATAQGQLTGALAGMRGADSAMAIESARQRLAADTTSAGHQLDVNRLRAQLAQDAAARNQASGLEAQQLTNTYKLGLGSQALGASGMANDLTAQKMAIKQGDKDRRLKLTGALVQGGANMGAAAATGKPT